MIERCYIDGKHESWGDPEPHEWNLKHDNYGSLERERGDANQEKLGEADAAGVVGPIPTSRLQHHERKRERENANCNPKQIGVGKGMDLERFSKLSSPRGYNMLIRI